MFLHNALTSHSSIWNDKQVRQTHSARGRMKNKWDRGTRFLGRSNCARAMSVECTPCNRRDFQTFSYKILYVSTWEVLSFFFQRMLMFTVWVYGSWAKEVDSKSPQFFYIIWVRSSRSTNLRISGNSLPQSMRLTSIMNDGYQELTGRIDWDWLSDACLQLQKYSPSPSSRCIVHIVVQPFVMQPAI